MSVYPIPVLDSAAPEFEQVATRVPWPGRDPSQGTQFFPAVTTFGIPASDKVDVSVFYINPGTDPEPAALCDRHVDSEELFVALQGDFLLAIAARSTFPPDPDELPDPSAMTAYVVHEGDAFILPTNTWHTGCWAADPAEPVTFLMIISGHRKGEQGKAVDHEVRGFEGGGGVMPQTQVG